MLPSFLICVLADLAIDPNSWTAQCQLAVGLKWYVNQSPGLTNKNVNVTCNIDGATTLNESRRKSNIWSNCYSLRYYFLFYAWRAKESSFRCHFVVFLRIFRCSMKIVPTHEKHQNRCSFSLSKINIFA